MEISIPGGNFTLDDLLHTLHGKPDLDGYHTAEEWCSKLSTWPGKMHRLLKEAKSKRLLQVAREQRESIDGAMRWVPVYKFGSQSSEEG